GHVHAPQHIRIDPSWRTCGENHRITSAACCKCEAEQFLLTVSGEDGYLLAFQQLRESLRMPGTRACAEEGPPGSLGHFSQPVAADGQYGVIGPVGNHDLRQGVRFRRCVEQHVERSPGGTAEPSHECCQLLPAYLLRKGFYDS